MEQLNRYYRCSKISERKFLRVLRHFALDLTASRTAQLTGLTRKSVTTIFLKIRERIAGECERASPFPRCEVEVDESYFGARRVLGKRGRVAAPDAVTHSDGRRGYDGLVDVGYSEHFSVRHGSNESARGEAHVNGVEGFRSFAQRRLQKFNGVSARTFNLHLKECEYRFNNRDKNLYGELLKLLRKNPL